MRASLLSTIFFVVLTFYSKAQLFREVPHDFRYQLELAFPFVENQLVVSKNDQTSAKWKIVLAELYTRKGKYAIADSILLSLSNQEGFSDAITFQYLLAKALVAKFNRTADIADNAFTQAINFARSKNNKFWELEVLIEKAEFNRKISNYYVARKTITGVLEQLKNPKEEHCNLTAYALGRYAAILNERNENQKAIEISKKSLKYSRLADNSYLQGVSYNEIGYAYKQFVEVDSTFRYYNKAYEVFESSGMLIDAAHVRFNQIQFSSHNNLYLDSLKIWWENLIEFVDKNDLDYPTHNAWYSLSGQYAKYGQWEKAYRAYNNFHNAFYNDFEVKRQQEIDKLSQEERNEKIRDEKETILSDLKENQAIIGRQQKRIIGVVLVLALTLLLMFFVARLYLRSNRLAKKLEVQNQEKDILIQEVHHRVKNNLNFIHSLLEMQESSCHSIDESVGLKKASVRISSVSELHKMLFKDNESDMTNLTQYTKALLSSLKNTFESPDQTIEVDIDLKNVEMNIQDCTAYGQLVTECFTNSVKHAFPKISSPRFYIQLNHIKEYEYELTIGDNGESAIELKENDVSLGMRLIAIFSRQLRGQYSISFNPGFTYVLNFELNGC